MNLFWCVENVDLFVLSQYTCLTDGQNSMATTWAEANIRTKWHLDPSSHLATTDMGRKLAGEGELGPHLTQCG